jgi:hypothetical protein
MKTVDQRRSDRELAAQNIHVYPPNKKGEPWIAVKFGLAGPRSSLEAFGATEQLALSTLRLKMMGHWVVLEQAS